ncbi:TPA: hypothetical protein ACT5CB_004986, partial [Burkholderia cenocepacia]
RTAAHARRPARVPAGTAPARRTTRRHAARPTTGARQPPLAPAGAEAAPGMLAPASPGVPAAPLLGVPDGAVDGATDMPLAAPESELVAPLSPFFWQPAPAARPAIRMPAKTARDT